MKGQLFDGGHFYQESFNLYWFSCYEALKALIIMWQQI